MKNIILSVVVLVVVVGGFYLLSKIPSDEAVKGVEFGDELRAEIAREGTGAEAKNGDKVSVHYVGVLEDGTKFDSSLDRGQPFVFSLGAGQVISGWDLGVVGMKVGEIRRLYIPSAYGYGEAGAGNGLIPANANLVFEVELLGIE
ncbi:FKBP-type peptidyl-prolyl cis-trans isomerase [Patescibacteria group bacterium]|nr:FKBP-type peptidyl-prolyl cis-trans isomerase [Patescibacteria group bacterium]MBU2579810.1 FKBP-type peptidyl-prolyl cis-trans isomerase [Patescibacteria group bacterium]